MLAPYIFCKIHHESMLTEYVKFTFMIFKKCKVKMSLFSNWLMLKGWHTSCNGD